MCRLERTRFMLDMPSRKCEQVLLFSGTGLV